MGAAEAALPLVSWRGVWAPDRPCFWIRPFEGGEPAALVQVGWSRGEDVLCLLLLEVALYFAAGACLGVVGVAAGHAQGAALA